VQPYNPAGSNAHNLIGPRAIAACVKLYGVDNSLTTHRRFAIRKEKSTHVSAMFWLEAKLVVRCGQKW